MRMAFFGRKFDAPIYDGAPRIDTPVGETCVWCDKTFAAGDDGFMYVSGEYTHMECNVRQVLPPGLANTVLASMRPRPSILGRNGTP